MLEWFAANAMDTNNEERPWLILLFVYFKYHNRMSHSKTALYTPAFQSTCIAAINNDMVSYKNMKLYSVVLTKRYTRQLFTKNWSW